MHGSERAAEGGDPRDKYNLAISLVMYHYRSEAESLYRELAQTDDADGTYGLASLLYSRGEPESEYWFRRAAELGHPNALTYVANLEKSGSKRGRRPLLRPLTRFKLRQSPQCGDAPAEE